MKRIFFQPVFSIVLLTAILFFSNKATAQTDAISFDFTGSTLGFGFNCNGDATYDGGTSGSKSVATTSIASNATVNSVSLDIDYGKIGFGGSSISFTFLLNGHSVGTASTNSFCNSQSITGIDPAYLNADGPNTVSFTSNSNSAGVYNATLTVDYSVCTPPQAPEVPTDLEYCLNETASALTATGTNLLWYSSPDDATGSTDAPVPPTNTAGTETFYVTQTIGCESDKAEVDVTINALPTSSIDDFTNVTCFDGSDGSITVHAIGGSGNGYSFSKDNGTTWFTPEDNGDTYKFEGLMANHAYQIMVKDGKSCASKKVQ